MRPQMEIWSKMLCIGVPAGAEFMLTFFYFTTVYGVIRNFGPAAQAGFGIGSRMVQVLLLPVAALTLAVPPVVGQNFGAQRSDRLRSAVYSSIVIASLLMFIPMLIAYVAPAALIRVFSSDPQVIAFGSNYLRIASLVFVPAGIAFCTASVFQGLGNTWPPLLSSTTRLVSFVIPAIVLSRMPRFDIKYVWYLQVASVALQASFNLLMLRRELRIKLTFGRSDGVMLPRSSNA
jgi:Na+-driven multidrug efflux pump